MQYFFSNGDNDTDRKINGNDEPQKDMNFDSSPLSLFNSYAEE